MRMILQMFNSHTFNERDGCCDVLLIFECSIENVWNDAQGYVWTVTWYVAVPHDRSFSPYVRAGQVEAHIDLLLLNQHEVGIHICWKGCRSIIGVSELNPWCEVLKKGEILADWHRYVNSWADKWNSGIIMNKHEGEKSGTSVKDTEGVLSEQMVFT